MKCELNDKRRETIHTKFALWKLWGLWSSRSRRADSYQYCRHLTSKNGIWKIPHFLLSSESVFYFNLILAYPIISHDWSRVVITASRDLIWHLLSMIDYSSKTRAAVPCTSGCPLYFLLSLDETCLTIQALDGYLASMMFSDCPSNARLLQQRDISLWQYRGKWNYSFKWCLGSDV